MEEQRGFAAERVNYETRLGQVGLLQQEIEILRKQNADHELQLEFLKSQNSTESVIENLKTELATLCNEHAAEMAKKDQIITDKLAELKTANAKHDQLQTQHEYEITSLTANIEELTNENISKDAELKEIAKTVQDLEHEMNEEKEPVESVDNSNCELRSENDNLKVQLEETLEKLRTLQGEKEVELREISEENARLKIEFNDLNQELKELKTEFADYEVQLLFLL